MSLDAVSTIVDAVTDGAAAGATTVSADVVKGVYATFLAMLRNRFAGDDAAEEALDRQVVDPTTNPAELRAHVENLEPGARDVLLPYAVELLQLLSARGSSYAVSATKIQGLVQGDNNDVRMKFTDD